MKNIIIEILERELWHFKLVRDKWLKDIQLNGPDEQICSFYNEANKKVSEIETAIAQVHGFFPMN